jgi:O-antigen/teichoic acid export membrane protein
MLLVVGPLRSEAGWRAAKKLGWLIVYTLLTHLCLAYAVIVLTADLGRERFGILTFALSVQSYLFLLGCLGVKEVVVREAARHPEQLDRITASHLVITGSCSGLVCLLTLAGAALAPISDAERLLLAVLACGNIAGCVNILPLFDVHHQQPFSAAITLATELGALLAILVLHQTGRADLPAVGAAFAAKWTASAGGHYLAYHRWVRPVRLTFSLAHVRALLPSCWPLVLSALVARVPFSSGPLFVRCFRGEGDTAVFGIAAQVATAYLLFAMAGNRIFQPHMAGRAGLSKDFIGKLALSVGLFLGLLLVGAFAAGSLAIVFLLGPQYRPALTPMAILLAGTFVFCLGNVASNYLVILRHEKGKLSADFGASVAYVVGCLVTVPWLSYTGAALAMAAASLIGTAMIFASLRAYWTCVRGEELLDLACPSPVGRARAAVDRPGGCEGKVG